MRLEFLNTVKTVACFRNLLVVFKAVAAPGESNFDFSPHTIRYDRRDSKAEYTA